MALVAPVLAAVLIAAIDVGGAALTKAQIARALAGSAEYATLAGQNGVASTTIIANAIALAGAVTSSFVGKATVTAVVNNGAASGSTCCVGNSWSCSTASGFTCVDGSAPGTFLTVTARFPFTPLFPTDTMLIGKSLSDSVIAPLQ
jgi:Flp pilus assembly protein TadG